MNGGEFHFSHGLKVFLHQALLAANCCSLGSCHQWMHHYQLCASDWCHFLHPSFAWEGSLFEAFCCCFYLFSNWQFFESCYQEGVRNGLSF